MRRSASSGAERSLGIFVVYIVIDRQQPEYSYSICKYITRLKW